MNTGIRRKVDDLGRVVIPAGIRRSLNIREGDALEVHVEGDDVIFCKSADQCVFCGSDEGLQGFRAKLVCRSCIVAVGALNGRPATPTLDHAAGSDRPTARRAAAPISQPERDLSSTTW